MLTRQEKDVAGSGPVSMSSQDRAHDIEKLTLHLARRQADRLHLERKLEDSRVERELIRRRMLHNARLAGEAASLSIPIDKELRSIQAERDTWFLPRISALEARVQELEQVKRDWFEPQLESRLAHITALERQVADLQGRLASMEGFERSRSFRAWKRLRRLFRLDRQ